LAPFFLLFLLLLLLPTFLSDHRKNSSHTCSFLGPL
jgi:hypothetical protein